MEPHLSKEQFELIRNVLREKAGTTESRPLKRRRRNRGQVEQDTPSTEPTFVINISDEDEKSKSDVIDLLSQDEKEKTDDVVGDSLNDGDQNSEDEDEDFDSDEFEDVTDIATTVEDVNGVTVTLDRSNTTEKSKKQTVRNICSNEERKFRKDFHMMYLAALMIAGYMKNEWLNSPRLQKKLSNLVTDKTLQLLHPEKDDEMPLRSTRKLLDGLKKVMDIWEKHWKIIRNYDGNSYYMRFWNELNSNSDLKSVMNQSKSITKKAFIKYVSRGIGDRDMATQGFISLLRACNLNARLIMSCQPPDFTNLKVEEEKNDYKLQNELIKYPIFWCEVWDKFSKKWLTVDPVNLKIIEQVRLSSKLEPKGTLCCKRNILRYVIAYDRKLGCRDVTRRYMRWFNSKGRRRRITKDPDGEEWFEKLLSSLHRRNRMKTDDFENSYFEERDRNEGMPNNLQDFKGHPYYVLENSLNKNQLLKPGCKECGFLKLHNKTKHVLKVYLKSDVMTLRSPRDWFMRGRVLKKGARCMKTVKANRFRKVNKDYDDDDDDTERLYKYEDTELYIAPLADYTGEIKKNSYGNIEIFVPSMIPANCSFIENPVSIKACKFLNIEYAPAVTKFKFEKGSKVKPVISGVVVARWYKDAVLSMIDGIEYLKEEDDFKEAEFNALKNWQTLLMKLAIQNNLNATYGTVSEENSGETEVLQQEDQDEQSKNDFDNFEAGGFLLTSNDKVGASHLNGIRDDSEAGVEEEDEEEEEEEEEEIPMGGFIKPTSIAHHDEESSQKDDTVDVDIISNDDIVTSSKNSEDENSEYNNFMNELGI